MRRTPERAELLKVNQLIKDIHSRKHQLSQFPPDIQLSKNQLRMKKNLEVTIQVAIRHLMSVVREFDVIPPGVFTVIY